jgi:hypothetical protein
MQASEHAASISRVAESRTTAARRLRYQSANMKARLAEEIT